MADDATHLLRPLVEWFDTARRELPWRAAELDSPHPDPYAVLVSELMLQQTQVAAVVPFFQRWMAAFPDFNTLAEAEESEVFGLWSGLGYYQRARNLHRTAKQLAQQGWPGTLEGLRALPGLGPYAAAAVASIAFQIPAPALDGNAFRVIARLLGLEVDPRKRRGELEDWLRPALVQLGPSRLTQALMELGATHCGRRPRCASCPVAPHCAALSLGAQDRIPPVLKRPRPEETEIWLCAVQSRGHWLLCPPGRKGLLAGLWRWPALESSSASRQAPCPPSARILSWASWVQVYTHRREAVRPLSFEVPWVTPGEGFAWVPAEALAGLPMGRRDQKLRSLLQDSPVAVLEGHPAVEALQKSLRAGEALSG